MTPAADAAPVTAPRRPDQAPRIASVAALKRLLAADGVAGEEDAES